MGRIVLHRVSISASRMSVRYKQLRVVEGSRLIYCARIRQSIAQEINQVRLLLRAQPERDNVGIDQRNLVEAVREIAAAVVELDHLLQRELSAVVEVRCCERDVAQHGCLEEAVPRDVISATQRRSRKPVAGTSRHHE